MKLCDRNGLRVAELSRSALMNNVTPTAHESPQRAVYHRERATDTSDAAQDAKYNGIAELLDREAADPSGWSESQPGALAPAISTL
jgi:hypothetical protein